MAESHRFQAQERLRRKEYVLVGPEGFLPSILLLRPNILTKIAE